MIDKFDYEEPTCPLCDGKDFYYPQKDAPLGRIPIDRIIQRVDALFDKNDTDEAGRLLVYWRDEAIKLRDTHGELTVESELIGYYRKMGKRDEALASVARALELTALLGQEEMASGATVFINAATAYKAFGMAIEAMPLYERAGQVYKSVLPENDPRFGGLYNNMALALTDLGEFEKAEKAYFAALSVMTKISGGEPEAAITNINLAHMYEAWGKTDKLADCMQRAYELLHSENIRHDGYYAFVLEKCAPSFGYFGNIAAYEEFTREYERIYARA